MSRALVLPLLFVIALPLSAGAAPTGDKKTTVGTSSTRVVVKASPDDAPVRGPRDARVTVEFFCTFTHTPCAHMHELLRQLHDRHPERLRIIYRHVSLPYRDNQAIAEAAVEMWRQGRFMEFASLAYARPGQFALRDVEPAARKIGADVDKLRLALADKRHRSVLERDALWKDQLGVTSFPALLWNGNLHNPSARLEEYEALYDAAYAAAQRRVTDGLHPHRLYPVLLREGVRHRVSAHKDNPRQQIDLAAPRTFVRTDTSPARGPQTAPVTIVVFADFECPFCRRQLEPLHKIEQIFKDRVRVVFKHYPLAFHPNARPAAEAAQCANAQGKFWQYHDLLFKNYGRLRKPDLLRFATEAGLEVSRFTADLDSGKCAAAVDADVLEGKALGLEVTPTLFVNGLKLAGPRTLAELHIVVDDELTPGWLEGMTEDPL